MYLCRSQIDSLYICNKSITLKITNNLKKKKRAMNSPLSIVGERSFFLGRIFDILIGNSK